MKTQEMLNFQYGHQYWHFRSVKLFFSINLKIFTAFSSQMRMATNTLYKSRMKMIKTTVSRIQSAATKHKSLPLLTALFAQYVYLNCTWANSTANSMTCGKSLASQFCGKTMSGMSTELLEEIPWIMSWRIWVSKQSYPLYTPTTALGHLLFQHLMKKAMKHAILCMWLLTKVRSLWNHMGLAVHRRKRSKCSTHCPAKSHEEMKWWKWQLNAQHQVFTNQRRMVWQRDAWWHSCNYPRTPTWSLSHQSCTERLQTTVLQQPRCWWTVHKAYSNSNDQQSAERAPNNVEQSWHGGHWNWLFVWPGKWRIWPTEIDSTSGQNWKRKHTCSKPTGALHCWSAPPPCCPLPPKFKPQLELDKTVTSTWTLISSKIWTLSTRNQHQTSFSLIQMSQSTTPKSEHFSMQKFYQKLRQYKGFFWKKTELFSQANLWFDRPKWIYFGSNSVINFSVIKI